MPSLENMGTKMRFRTFALLVAAIAAAVVGWQSAARAADWPNRPIHLIVPFPAGSSSDIVARLVAKKLGERLQQTLVIENRSGASGSLGTEAVARAGADGYTLGLANTSTLTISPNLMAHPTYDPVKDFAPIAIIGVSPFVLAAYPGLPIHNVHELVALAKTQPGKLTFAEAGPETLANLAGLLFEKMANVQLTGISYRGSEQEVLDVIEGRVDMQFATIPPTLALIRQGKLRAIAVTGTQPSSALPDVPTIAESGLPGYEALLWQGLYAPAGTPAPILMRLHGETNAVLHDADVADGLKKLGVEPQPSPQQEFAARIAAELKKWHEVILSAGLKPQ
jgi:tripartite-type tricarboxylate transporter receptor subunit TctC